MNDVAKVSGSPISRFELDSTIESYAVEFYHRSRRQLSDDERREARGLAMDKLIARELIYLEALSQGVIATQEDVDRELEKAVKDHRGEQGFLKTLQKAGIDALTYQRILRKDATVSLLSRRMEEEIEDPDEEQLRRFYDEHRQQLKKPARVRASHILVLMEEGNRDEALKEIEALKEASRTEDFAELARRSSQCPSASSGGDLGFFKRRDMAESFSEAAFAQPIGEVGEPVETGFGFHLIKVVDREEEAELTFEQALPQIRDYVRREESARRMREWVATLKSKAEIEILDD